MGEIADAMLNGVMCASCGELFGDVLDDGFEEPGYPRYCDGCEPPGYPRNSDADEPPKRRRAKK